MATSEIDFNSRFAEVLSECAGLGEQGVLQAEKYGLLQESSRKRTDVLFDVADLPALVVECKFASSAGDPLADAKGRLGKVCSSKTQHVAGESIRHAAALLYPEGAEIWDVKDIPSKFAAGGERLQWKLMSLNDDKSVSVFPQDGWMSGEIHDFWESVSRAALGAEVLERVGGNVASLLKSAARHMLTQLAAHPEEKTRIATSMGEIEDDQAGMEIACVVWLDALLMMNELARQGKLLRPDMKSAKPASSCLTSGGEVSVSEICREWNKVLVDNYDSVFRPAKEALPNGTMSWGNMSTAFNLIMSAVEEIESAKLSKIANVGGEIFARVMRQKQRKNTAAFYTRPQVAEFLVAMVMPTREALPDDWRMWRVADFACGTGSLLRAAYRRLIRFSQQENVTAEEFHKHMMEQNICGLDISAIAAHLSATTIVSLFPSVSYDAMNIGMVKFGQDGGNVYTGSLELFNPKHGQQLFNTNFEATKGTSEEDKSMNRLTAPDGFFSSVIMNPPFSRTRKGQSIADLSGVSEAERKKIQRRIAKIRRNTDGDGRAGIASDFVALASQKLAEGGRVGLVLPLTMASAGSWQGIRDHLIENFRNIVVVFFATGVKGGEESMSNDTNMGEVMLIARKGEQGRKGVMYVCIDEMFSSASIAAEIARQVSATENLIGQSDETKGVLYVGGDRVGEWRHVENPANVWGSAGARDLHGIASIAEILSGGGSVGCNQNSMASMSNADTFQDRFFARKNRVFRDCA